MAPHSLPGCVRLFESIRSDEHKSERLRGDLLEAEAARVHPESLSSEPRSGERDVPIALTAAIPCRSAVGPAWDHRGMSTRQTTDHKHYCSNCGNEKAYCTCGTETR